MTAFRMIELPMFSESSVWVAPAHITSMQDLYGPADEWIGAEVWLSSGRRILTVLPAGDILRKLGQQTL